MPQWCFINKDFLRKEEALLPVQDLAVQRGYGVFDYIRVLDGISLFAEAHLQRLLRSSAAMRLPISFSSEELLRLITELIRRNEMKDSGIRITVTGGTSPDGFSIAEPNIIIAEHPFTPLSKEKQAQGIRLVTHEHQRQMAAIKTIDYLMAIWLGPFIKDQRADDVLYTSNGQVTECPRANFFLLDVHNRLATPNTRILEGITRNNLLACASELNMNVDQREVHVSELSSARGAFICSTTKGLLPVASINGIDFERSHEIFGALQAALARRIEDYKHANKPAPLYAGS